MQPVIAVTTGEPAGIGPEISLHAAWTLRTSHCLVLLGDLRALSSLAARIDPAIRLKPIAPNALPDAGRRTQAEGALPVIDTPMPVPPLAGQLDPRNGGAMLQMLDIAIDCACQHQVAAIVTAPLQKSTINDAGIAFTGHTEYLAEKTGTRQVVMMLAGSVSHGDETFPLRVALATTHLPLKDVAAAITPEGLGRTLDILYRDLRQHFGIAAPRILVCGLNPHAGEGGYLGREEIDVIAPTIAAAQQRGIDARGPYPADTLFQPKFLRDADCVLAMYHDQGLPVLKHASFGEAVNVTLGLPIIRTSVDHGTALDQAQRGVGHASHQSMIAAIRLAAQMAERARI